MFLCSLRYFANVPLFPKTPGRPSVIRPFSATKYCQLRIDKPSQVDKCFILHSKCVRPYVANLILVRVKFSPLRPPHSAKQCQIKRDFYGHYIYPNPRVFLTSLTFPMMLPPPAPRSKADAAEFSLFACLVAS